MTIKEIERRNQDHQLSNPDSRIILDSLEQHELLSRVADYGKGSTTGDRPRFLRCYWEIPKLTQYHERWLDSTENEDPWSGREHVTTQPIDSPEITSQFGCRILGQEVWSSVPGHK